MTLENEKRRSPRIAMVWPAVITTVNGAVAGETENISLFGAFVRCSQVVDLSDVFRLVLKPPGEKLLLPTAEVVWSDVFYQKGGFSHGIGVRFRYLVDEDRLFISHLISGAVAGTARER